jgi:hypothetical protein
LSFFGLAKNLFDGLVLAALNPLIEVFERAVEPLAQGSPHGSLSCAHETH